MGNRIVAAERAIVDTQPTDNLGAAFIRLQQHLRNYLRRRVSDDAAAEDLLQDVFVKALVAEGAGRQIGNLTGWLYAAVRTTLVDHYRAAGEPMQELDEEIPDWEVDDQRLHQELSNCLRPFIDRLAPIYRDTLIATDLDGSTMRSFAQAQQVSISAIKSRAVRARAMLKTELLACCRLEMIDGTVTDYARVSVRRGQQGRDDGTDSASKRTAKGTNGCC